MSRGKVKRRRPPQPTEKNFQVPPEAISQEEQKSIGDTLNLRRQVNGPFVLVSVFVVALGIAYVLSVAITSVILEDELYQQQELQQQQRIDNFLQWFHDEGGTMSPNVTLTEFPEFGGFGIKAVSAVHNQEELFTIPSNIVISAQSVVQKYSSYDSDIDIEHKVRAVFRSPLVQQDVVIALYFLAECSLGIASEILAYMHVLPSRYIPRLDTFATDEEALEMLDDDYLKDLAKQSRAELVKGWNDGIQELASYMANLAKKHSNRIRAFRNHQVQTQCLSFEMFHHFLTIVSSRAMILEGGAKYLAPPADFINYQSRHDNRKAKMSESFRRYHNRNSDGSITVRADRSTILGEQVFEDYGDTDNTLYLEAFGFVPNDNPLHCSVIPQDLVPQPSSLPSGLVAVLRFSGSIRDETSPSPMVCILSDGSIANDKAEAYLEIVELVSGDRKKQLHKCIGALREKKERLYSECFEYPGRQKALKMRAKKLARKAYCNAKTTIEEDETLLQSIGPENERRAIAIKFRIQEKKCLQAAAGGSISCLPGELQSSGTEL